MVAFFVSTVLGFLAGLGIGGGSLLILYLTLMLDMAYPVAKIYNLLFFIPSAIISSVFRKKQGTLPLGKVLPAVIAGCIASAVFSFFSSSFPLNLLKKLFGGLLIITGTREILYKDKSNNTN
ncbi:MAG: TSUP family transporter [Oscillospiraceae bacterium]|nr:TSUP family transporter [Oscillospiraceae bacterium]